MRRVTLKLIVMEERNLNTNESLELITRMINSAKDRLRIGDGNVMLLWGYLTVAVTALVWGLLAIYRHPAFNYLFFLIWIIGGIVAPRIEKKQETGAKTYVDCISSGIWKIVGYSAIATTLICLGFFFVGGEDCWGVMVLFSLIIIGFAVAVQGLVIKEKSLVAGGSVGLLCGLVAAAVLVGGMKLYALWFFPMFIVAFTAMLIIPGHLLNCKARRQCSVN